MEKTEELMKPHRWVFRLSHCYACERIKMATIPDKKLREIFSALDAYLGDTDPDFPEDATDDEIRIEEPVFWAAKELSVYLKRA